MKRVSNAISIPPKAGMAMGTTGYVLGTAAFWTDGWTTTLNIYSQVGLVTLVGVVSKNGILMVEFADQLLVPSHGKIGLDTRLQRHQAQLLELGLQLLYARVLGILDLDLLHRDLVDLLATGGDTGQVRGRLQAGFTLQARDRGMGAFAG